MCNLYQHTLSPSEIAAVFGTTPLGLSTDAWTANVEPGYVGADQDGPVLVTNDAGKLAFATKRWGFPKVRKGIKPITNIRNLNSSWWKGANGEFIREAKYRCLVPFTRFAEWSVADKANAWFEIDCPTPFFAGVWRPWTGERLAKVEGKKRRERRVQAWSLFAFLTTEANEVVGAVHPKAMPVILTTAEECVRWMAGGEDSLSLQRPLPDEMVKRMS